MAARKLGSGGFALWASTMLQASGNFPDASRLCEYGGEEGWPLWNGRTPGDEEKGMLSKFPSNGTKTPQWQSTGGKSLQRGPGPHCQWILGWAQLRRCLCKREKPGLISKRQKKRKIFEKTKPWPEAWFTVLRRSGWLTFHTNCTGPWIAFFH